MNTQKRAIATTATGPLAGYKILDLTAVVLGPVATQILGDYGAEIIKVESPDGDMMRSNGVSINKGMSSIFLNLNRNKKSISIDLKTKKGKQLLFQLASKADVLVHNMRVDAIERLGLGYKAIEKINSKIVYCVATGYGEEGPYAGRPAFDDVIQGACGLANLVGLEDGIPKYPPTLLADKVTGIYLANAILAALLYKEKTGEGQYVEVPMLETMVSFTMAEHLGGKTFDPQQGPAGYARLVQGGRRPIKTKDGFVSILPYTKQHWIAFFTNYNRLDLIEKYDWNNPSERNKRIAEIYEDLRVIVGNEYTDNIVFDCEKLDIPVTKIYSIQNIDEHPHIKSVNLFSQKKHPTEGQITAIEPTIKFEKSPASIRSLAPLLGQHTVEVLRKEGYEGKQLADLLELGVIKASKEG